MTAKEFTELQNRVDDIEETIRVLWSTLEAIADAMRAKHATLEHYQDAIYGLSRQAYCLKEEAGQLAEWLNAEGRNCS